MIQMVQGTYGYVGPDGILKPKTAKDGPFSVSEEQEARLVGLGVAVYTGEKTAENGAEEDVKPADEEPALEDMTAKELREVGKEYGLTFKVGMSKVEMIEAIKAEGGQEVEADGEELPAFDAAEAVE